MPAAVQVVELRFGDGVVDVDGGEEKCTGFHHLIEAVHTGGRFLGNSAQVFRHPRPALRILLELAAQQVEDDAVFLGILARVEFGNASRLLELDPLVDEERSVPAVVQQQIGS